MTFPEPNELARELNRRLEVAAPEVLAMLSPLGRRLHFPKGILTQSAEASAGAHRFNATIGIATVAGEPMHLPSVTRHLVELDPADAVDYAPAGGRRRLRERWREKQLGENPSQRGKRCGLPIVTSAITHGLSLAVTEGERTHRWTAAGRADDQPVRPRPPGSDAQTPSD